MFRQFNFCEKKVFHFVKSDHYFHKPFTVSPSDLVKTDNEDKEAVTSVFRMLFFLFVNHPSELLKLIFFSLLTFLLKFFRNTSLKISLSCAPA